MAFGSTFVTAALPTLSKIDTVAIKEIYVIGTVEMCLITDKGDHHYCITWKIPKFGEYISNGKLLNSPVFSLPKRNRCLWYLSVQSMYSVANIDIIFSSLRLVLDRKSDCKEAFATFKLFIEGQQNNPPSRKTSKFNTKSDHSEGVLCSFSTENIRRFTQYTATIKCEIMIETTFFEDNSFSNDFESLKNRLPTDVLLSVGEKNFPAHKTILIARSSVFAAMFAHDVTEAQGVVYIKDMDEDVVEEMLRYIYTGESEKLKDVAEELLIAANKYDLKGLRIKCEEILIASLSSSNAFDLLLLADLHNANNLKFETINFITVRSKELMKTSTWEILCQSNPEVIREIAEAFLQPKLTVVAESK